MDAGGEPTGMCSWRLRLGMSMINIVILMQLITNNSQKREIFIALSYSKPIFLCLRLFRIMQH